MRPPLTAPDPGRTLPDLFEAQVARTPDAIAVTFEDTSLTYRELDARATALAHRLADAGVGPERLVAVSLPRSADLVVALLAVLKAGGAYVPVDPAYPADRVEFLLADTRPVLTLTPDSIADLLSTVERPVVPRRARPDSPAYVIHTSGSTGTPKGVVVSHRNVVRLFDATRSWLDAGPLDVWTLFHSHAFDFSVWEMWGALLHGGRLVVVPHAVTRSPEDFLRLLERERVTVLNQTPTAFAQLPPADLDALRLVVFGGEALEDGHLADWRRT
ncbi:MAG TPA: AMP-binding protein, partial [Umezawaea sp.]|nr:AMP-binding protein [Umezawaea sp.]